MIKKAGTDDLETLAKLAAMMWQNHSIHELIDEFSENMNMACRLVLHNVNCDLIMWKGQGHLRLDI